MSAFVATHVIEGPAGEQRLVHLSDGVLYTWAEWEACAPGEWEISEDGSLLFQGAVRDGYGFRAVKS